MKKIVIVLYGPPGSGKGTQANLLATKFGLIHFDTGRFLESLLHDPARQKEKIIKQQRKLFDTGMLNSASFVSTETEKETRKIAGVGWGVVFSGSPRTFPEAKLLYPAFDKLYGKKNVFIFKLSVPDGYSVKRNSARMVCTICGYTLLTEFYPAARSKHCPICAGSFYKRTLDKPEIIKIRLKEYKTKTLPIIDFIKKRGYHVFPINARPAPYKILAEITKHIKK
jgi:adenylate kinase